jgi:hypothetical protein
MASPTGRRGGLEAPESLGYQGIRENERTTGEVSFMAIDTTGGHPAMDYAEHRRTYANFLAWTKVTIVFLVVLLSGMAFFLV